MRTWLTSGNLPSLLTTIFLVVPGVSWGQETPLVEVLTRTTDYVNMLHDQLEGVVSEERYEQRSSRIWGFSLDEYEYRALRSDYLLIQPEGSERYYGFRDVYEVDGLAVRDRKERLTQLFLNDSASADQQIQGILSDSARYNIGDVERNVNTPTLALLFLHPSYKHRFEFEHVANASPPLGLDGPEDDDAVDIWVIEYTETCAPCLVTGPGEQNMPARGRFWIDSATGRVLVSELIFKLTNFSATIAVKYETNTVMGHAVPIEMRERYDTPSGFRIDGTATYTSFRQFQVQVDESTPFRD